ncbi:hypothetical protein N7478_007169 [Penicillium angulare]|uniref:uncharacterized protein n=1 Tax=Penicillium angulare TaxID=116970 RepID=UPI00254070BE|nr:uncharacterized protein N7478_007169 [Penicillium angulare]KAJ5281797.1 hypothetical protein N7478_007169 [Penicillium angulare]
MDRPLEPMTLSVDNSQTQSSRWEKLQPALVVTSSTALVFTVCGINFSFGVWQELYESMSKTPNTPFTGATPAQIDLIGTLAIALMTAGAPFTTAWTKQYSPRAVVCSGSIIYAVALVLASFSQSLWQFILTQGVLVGVGTCMTYMPPVTVAPTWFSQNRGLAMGIIMSGTGAGGVAWPLAFRSLIERVGFRNTLRITACIAFALNLTAGMFMKWPPSQIARIQAEEAASSRSRPRNLFLIPVMDWRVARTRQFAAHALGASLQSAAYYTPVFFFSAFARTLGYSTTSSANFIAISNGANALSRVAIGYFADRMGRLNILLATTFIAAVAVLTLWLPASLASSQSTASALFIVFSISYGIFASAYVSLFPASLVELFGVQHFVSVNGALYMIRGLATLLGTPIAGVLIRSSQTQSASPKSYTNTSIMVGILMAAATFAVLWTRFEAVFSMERSQNPRRKWII